MRDFMIFLENYSVKVTAEKVYEYECDNSLVFEKDGNRVAEFNIDKICGYALAFRIKDDAICKGQKVSDGTESKTK